MDPSEKDARYAVTLAIPDITRLPQRTPRIIEWQQNLTKISLQ